MQITPRPPTGRLLPVFLMCMSMCACAASPRARSATPPSDEDDPAARTALLSAALEGYRASYVLTWNGARIGEAHERFYASDDAEGGYRFERSERIVVRRGDAIATSRTVIRIDLDQTMSARRLLVDRTAGGGRVRAEATRQVDSGWRVTYGSAAARVVDGAAVPATLVPLLIAAAGVSPGVAFQGAILVEGAGLAQAQLTVTIGDDARSALADVRTAAGPLRSAAKLDERGFLIEGGVGAALASRRVHADELAAEFDPPEIVDSAAVLVAGDAPSRNGGALELTVSNVQAPPPAIAELPEQMVTLGGSGAWDVTVDPTAVTSSAAFRVVRERTTWVSRALADDLTLAAMTSDEALAAGRGDCTAHAIVLQKELEARGYEARLVTGWVLDDGSLRRHRWVVVHVDRRWVPVDPMFDEAPASPAHLALAVHGSGPDELAFIDDVAFAGWQTAIAGYR